jgi:hypothetical protein
MDLTLTPEQRDTLNAAEAILRGVLRPGGHWMFSIAARSEPGEGTYCSATYFDSNKTQHSDLWAPDCTFADKIQIGLDRERNLPTAEEAKAARVAELQAQLARLTGEAA